MYKIRLLLVNLLTLTVGNLLVFLLPKKVRNLKKKGLTLVLAGNFTPAERLMRRAILKKVEKAENFAKLAQLHQDYWINQGDVFSSETKGQVKSHALPKFKFVFENLKELLAKNPGKFKTLVEIGTANGELLEYLCNTFPQLNTLIGIDLSDSQTAINQYNYSNNKRLQFVASDVIDWVTKNGHDNTIFVTFNGVLEYLSEKQVKILFNKINDLGDSIFLAIEPKARKHDFDKNSNSIVYGFESSFSHNYPKLFRDCGFKLWHLSYLDDNSMHLVNGFYGAKNF